jgi:hypothetical protein
VLGDPEPWRARGLARASSYTWSRCAQLTVDAYAVAREGPLGAHPRSRRMTS